MPSIVELRIIRLGAARRAPMVAVFAAHECVGLVVGDESLRLRVELSERPRRVAMLPRWHSDVDRCPVSASALSLAAPRMASHKFCTWATSFCAAGRDRSPRPTVACRRHDLDLAAAAEEHLPLGAVELGAAVDSCRDSSCDQSRCS